MDAADLGRCRTGEILVARITAPSWGPVFGRIGAVVTDIGGMMSHAAIVCREYGLPGGHRHGIGDRHDPDRRPRGPRRRRRGHRLRSSLDRRYAQAWAAARPYMRARKNDVHIPLSFGTRERLLERHPEADADVVLLAIMFHDTGWAVIDEERIFREGFAHGRR